MTIDSEGNVYLTGDGVTVFDRTGSQIAHIAVAEPWTANVCFGGKDRRTSSSPPASTSTASARAPAAWAASEPPVGGDVEHPHRPVPPRFLRISFRVVRVFRGSTHSPPAGSGGINLNREMREFRERDAGNAVRLSELLRVSRPTGF